MGTNYECCMCGDYGLANELFRCKICHFRSQHRYCSNLYPKAETYKVCNWCLIEAAADQNKTTNSSSSNSASSSPAGTGEGEPRHPSHGKSRKKSIGYCSSSHLYEGSTMIKKQKSPEGSSVATSSPGRRIVAAMAGKGGNGSTTKVDERENKSEEMANGNATSGIVKQVFRGKARRYKLLDEVSS